MSYATYRNIGKNQEKQQEEIKDHKVIDIIDENHKHSLILEAKNKGQLLIIDVYGDWCGPCKKIKPDYQLLSLKYPTVLFCCENVNKNISPDVTGVPCFQYWGKGNKLDVSMGADITLVENNIQKFLKKDTQGIQPGMPGHIPSGIKNNNNIPPVFRPTKIPHGVRRS